MDLYTDTVLLDGAISCSTYLAFFFLLLSMHMLIMQHVFNYCRPLDFLCTTTTTTTTMVNPGIEFPALWCEIKKETVSVESKDVIIRNLFVVLCPCCMCCQDGYTRKMVPITCRANSILVFKKPISIQIKYKSNSFLSFFLFFFLPLSPGQPELYGSYHLLQSYFFLCPSPWPT